MYLVKNENTEVKAAAKVIIVGENKSQYKLMINREIGIMIWYQHHAIKNFLVTHSKIFMIKTMLQYSWNMQRKVH